MEARILVVDDEAPLLRAFARFARLVRPEWTVQIEQDSRKALGRLDVESWDMVVSDLKMPNVDGVEVLETARRVQPGAARVLWTGTIEGQAAHGAIPVAHQLFRKPLAIESFVEAIDRVMAMRNRFPSPEIRDAVASLTWVPSLPDTFDAINGCLTDPEQSIDDVIEAVRADAAQTAKVLQLVNSAFIGLGREVTDVKTAVRVLGLRMLRDLQVMAAVFDQGQLDTPIGKLLPAVRDHGLFCGKLAHSIAKGGEDGARERTVAMLSSIGLAVLAANRPRSYVPVLDLVRNSPVTLAEAEREVMGITHRDISAYLLALWALPDGVVDGVSEGTHDGRLARALAAELLPGAVAQWLRDEADPSEVRRWRGVASRIAGG